MVRRQAEEEVLVAQGDGMSYWQFGPGDIIHDMWGSVAEVLRRDEGPPRPYYLVCELLNVHKRTSIVSDRDDLGYERVRTIEKDDHGKEVLWPVANVKGRWKGEVDDLPEKPSWWVQDNRRDSAEEAEEVEVTRRARAPRGADDSQGD